MYLVRVSVPSRVRNLRKMRNFWANFTDFEPEINIVKCKTEKLKQKTHYALLIFKARLPKLRCALAKSKLHLRMLRCAFLLTAIVALYCVALQQFQRKCPALHK